jgi:hypothetical protein
MKVLVSRDWRPDCPRCGFLVCFCWFILRRCRSIALSKRIIGESQIIKYFGMISSWPARGTMCKRSPVEGGTADIKKGDCKGSVYLMMATVGRSI